MDERTGMQCGSSLDARLMGIIEPSATETRARRSIPVSAFGGINTFVDDEGNSTNYFNKRSNYHFSCVALPNIN